ncbi:MAG TPA: esterase-like activity of phytase family protein, partial [Gemmatales bacterium]|nr:esterase-like activity of phytase family protein [Gemmatales bacterium]
MPLIRLLVLITSFCFAGNCNAQVTLLGVGSLPGDMSDLSGLTGNQSDGTPHNRLGGMGSAIDYTGQGNSYVLASDRGPKDGATDYACRYHRMDIVVTPANGKVEIQLTGTTLLRDEKDRPFLGLLSAFNANYPDDSLRLDPEGVRVGPDGHLFIADEYGPYLYEFHPSGKRVRSFRLPEKFLPSVIAAKPELEMPPHNKKGRQPNRGMEGLAISPDGSTLVGIMQSPLIQDGGLDANNKRVGVNCRILALNRLTGDTREWVYRLDSGSHGISEILAVDAKRYLVLERDSKGGTETKCKK